ncbi:MAG: peptidoglycan editing factor PgeF [Cyanobacteria bacterium P01_A01_bin.105]
MHAWTWQTWQDRAFLTCDLLAPWPHGFFSRHFAPARPEQLVPALAPQAAVFRTKQVHGNGVLAAAVIANQAATAASEPASAAPPPADGCYSVAPQQAMWVCTADCTPALVGDVRTGQVAAVHAGWRGTAQRILPMAVAKLQAQGSVLADLRVALGPAIDGQVYQVGTEVAVETGKSISVPPPQFQPSAALLTHLQSLTPPAVLPDEAPDRVRLDVRQINRLQMLDLGLTDRQIAIAPHCTYQEPETFFSYRRTGERQVQWSGIVSR